MKPRLITFHETTDSIHECIYTGCSTMFAYSCAVNVYFHGRFPFCTLPPPLHHHSHPHPSRMHTLTTQADMSALLCQYGATSADAAHTQRLQRALDQCKSENQTLLSKLHRLEKQQTEAATAQQRRSAFVDYGNKAEYVQFLEQELERAK